MFSKGFVKSLEQQFLRPSTNSSSLMTLKNLEQNAINCIKLRGYLNYCVKGVRIWSFSGLYFPAFGLNVAKCRPENSEYGHFLRGD